MLSSEAALKKMIERAASLGLSPVDVKHATEFLEHHEYKLGFDQVLTQLYEFNISIDQDFYELIQRVARKLKIRDAEYLILKENIR